MHGEGKLTYASGKVFIGEFKSNLKHGSGLVKWSEDKSFKSNWLEGKIEGEGVLYFNNKLYKGEWSKGKHFRWSKCIDIFTESSLNLDIEALI